MILAHLAFDIQEGVSTCKKKMKELGFRANVSYEKAVASIVHNKKRLLCLSVHGNRYIHMYVCGWVGGCFGVYDVNV